MLPNAVCSQRIATSSKHKRHEDRGAVGVGREYGLFCLLMSCLGAVYKTNIQLLRDFTVPLKVTLQSETNGIPVRIIVGRGTMAQNWDIPVFLGNARAAHNRRHRPTVQ